MNKRSVHVCVSVIKGLPYEDILCGSRNTQKDLSLLCEAPTYTQAHTLKKYKQVKDRERRAKEEIDIRVSLRQREIQRQNI